MKLTSAVHFSGRLIGMHLFKGYRVPLSMYIVLTNRCNNHCLYCRVHNLDQKDGLTTTDLKGILRQMKSAGVFRIQLTGGEPMMRPDIGELIAFAKKLGFFIGMSTNGYQIHKRIKELKGLDVVFLSYDGPVEIHSRLRGEKSVDDFHTALAALKSSRIRVWTSTVLTTVSIGVIGRIVEFAKENGMLANFNRLEFCEENSRYLHPCFNEIKDLVPTAQQTRGAFEELIRLKKQGWSIGSSFEYLRSVLEWSNYEQVTASAVSKRYRCWAGRAYGHLEADGKLYPCGWAVPRGHAGVDVLAQGFNAAWEKIKPLDGCNSCSHACGVENNLIFSLNRSAIFNALVGLGR